jgi:uncharacterized membrane protein YgaE (UPF0421/DUF939 family)
MEIEDEETPFLPESKKNIRDITVKSEITKKIFCDILKAVIAFATACSFTFIETFNKGVGRTSYNAAIAILFFNPTQSVGALFESAVMGLLGTLFAFFICSIALYAGSSFNSSDMHYLSIPVYLLLLFLSTFLLAFLRARSSRPPVYTFTVLSHIIVSKILTSNIDENLSDFSLYQVWELIFPLCIGMTISLIVNVLIFPKSASLAVSVEITKMISSFQSLLNVLTLSFFMETEDLFKEDNNTLHSPIFPMNVGIDEIIKSGFKTHTAITISLYRCYEESKLEFWARFRGTRTDLFRNLISSTNKLTQHIGGMKSSVLKEDDMISKNRVSRANISFFSEIISHIRPSLRSLVDTCQNVLKEISSIVTDDSKKWVLWNNDSQTIEKLMALGKELEEALGNFDQSQKQVLHKLFENQKFDGNPNDEIFLVYFYVFCVIEFAKELLFLVSSIYQNETHIKPIKVEIQEEECESDEAALLTEENKKNYFRFLQSQTNPLYHSFLKSPESTLRVVEPRISPFLRLRLLLWRYLSDIGNSFQLKFALKTSLVITLIGSFSFIPQTKHFYRSYQGEWAIITCLIIMAPTVGGTNMAGFYRLLGSTTGILYSLLICNFFWDNSYLLFGMVFLFSIPCFYVFICTTFPKVAQVTLLSLVSIVLANFSKTWANPAFSLTVFDECFKRWTMTSLGIVFGLFTTWYWWPYEARVELRKGVSDLFLNMGVLYSRLVGIFKQESPKNPSPKITSRNLSRHMYITLTPDDQLDYFISFESKLHQTLLELKGLIPLTSLEPRLKGPLPVVVYEKIIESSQNILDNFLAMRVAIGNNIREGIHSEDLILGMVGSSEDFLVSNHELKPFRQEMIGNMLLSFYIFATSLMLKQPLPTILPNIKQARLRLLKNIQFAIRKDNSNNDIQSPTSIYPKITNNPQKYINYYAFAMALEAVVRELEKIGDLLKSLFGDMFSDVILDIGGNEEGSFNKRKFSEHCLKSKNPNLKRIQDIKESEFWRRSGVWNV